MVLWCACLTPAVLSRAQGPGDHRGCSPLSFRRHFLSGNASVHATDTAAGGELQSTGWDLCKVLDHLGIKLWEALRLEPLKPPRNAQASSENGLGGEVLLLQLFAGVFCLSLFPFIPPFNCHLMARGWCWLSPVTPRSPGRAVPTVAAGQ